MVLPTFGTEFATAIFQVERALRLTRPERISVRIQGDLRHRHCLGVIKYALLPIPTIAILDPEVAIRDAWTDWKAFSVQRGRLGGGSIIAFRVVP
jgi:hypothetical protein